MAAVGVAPRLGVHLVHERAGRVDDLAGRALRVLLHRRRDAVRREDADLALGNLVLVLDEDGAEPLEPAHDVLVVDDLVADVDRRAVLLEQPLDDLDRAVDAGAERARRREEDAAAVMRAQPPRARAAHVSASRIERTASPRAGRDPARAAPATFGAPVGVHGRVDALDRARRHRREIARTTPASRPLRGEHAALHVDRVRAARLVQAPTLRRVVDERVRREDGRRRARRARRAAAPPTASRRSRRRRASRRARRRREPVVQRAREPERDEPPVGHAVRRARRRRAPRVRPSRFATRSSAVVAQAKVSPSASTPCSGRSPSGSSTTRTPPTARSRSGCRSARSADRCPGRTPPTPSPRAAPRTSGRCRR